MLTTYCSIGFATTALLRLTGPSKQNSSSNEYQPYSEYIHTQTPTRPPSGMVGPWIRKGRCLIKKVALENTDRWLRLGIAIKRRKIQLIHPLSVPKCFRNHAHSQSKPLGGDSSQKQAEINAFGGTAVPVHSLNNGFCVFVYILKEISRCG